VPTSVRLLSVDARSFGHDRAAFAKVVANAAVDVVCVHGSPHLLRWRSISAALARQAGLVVVTGGRTAGANLLLSSLGVDVGVVRDVRFAGGSALRMPGAALAAVRLRGTEFVVVSATLVGNAAERLAQAHELQAAIDRLVPGGPPAIISVEGADRPGTAAWQALVGNRVGVAGRIFVDGRVGIEDATEAAGGSPLSPAVRLEISLP
jgi:hypothetical protein